MTKLKIQKVLGVITPLVSSWDSNSNADLEDLEKEVYSILPYVNGLFPAGNAGEGTVIDLDNWSSIVKTVIKVRDQSNYKVPVYAGIIKNNEKDISSFSSKAEKLQVDAIIIAPMCGKTPYEILETAINSTNLPIILYNNPSMHSDLELPLDFIKTAKNKFPERIIGIKSSTKDFELFKKILKLKTNTFKVFQGNTANAVESLKLGADGVVPAESCINPGIFKNLYNNRHNGDSKLFKTSLIELNNVFAEINLKKSNLNIKTMEAIKTILVERKIFKSSRMYSKQNK
jgi:4-hydroxy-tetrahydrodipicolinate synthase